MVLHQIANLDPPGCAGSIPAQGALYKMGIRKLSAGIVIREGEILMMQRKWEPHREKWCIPGGFTDKSINESVEDCCIRELKEETGIDVGIIKKVGIIKTYNERKQRDEEIHIFLCDPKNQEIVIDDKECLDVKWIVLDELNNLELMPGLKNFLDNSKIQEVNK